MKIEADYLVINCAAMLFNSYSDANNSIRLYSEGKRRAVHFILLSYPELRPEVAKYVRQFRARNRQEDAA